MTTEHLKALEALLSLVVIIAATGGGLLIGAIMILGIIYDIVKELRHGKR